MDRPRSLTRKMKLRAATQIVEQLISNRLLDAEEAEQAVQDIADSAGGLYSDGYSIAKNLDDRHGWDCNMRMAEELDRWSAEAGDELKAAEKAWFEAANPQPPFSVGARVKIPGDKTGTIDGIYDYGFAKYTVKLDGDPEAGPPSHARRIVNFEDAKAA